MRRLIATLPAALLSLAACDPSIEVTEIAQQSRLVFSTYPDTTVDVIMCPPDLRQRDDDVYTLKPGQDLIPIRFSFFDAEGLAQTVVGVRVNNGVIVTPGWIDYAEYGDRYGRDGFLRYRFVNGSLQFHVEDLADRGFPTRYDMDLLFDLTGPIARPVEIDVAAMDRRGNTRSLRVPIYRFEDNCRQP